MRREMGKGEVGTDEGGIQATVAIHVSTRDKDKRSQQRSDDDKDEKRDLGVYAANNDNGRKRIRVLCPEKQGRKGDGHRLRVTED